MNNENNSESIGSVNESLNAETQALVNKINHTEENSSDIIDNKVELKSMVEDKVALKTKIVKTVKPEDVLKNRMRNEKYIRANLTDYERYVIDSISDNDRPKLSNCLDYGIEKVNINKCINEFGTTILHYAAMKKDSLKLSFGSLNMLTMILQKGADYKAMDVDGLTALNYAEKRSNKYNTAILKEFITLKEKENAAREQRKLANIEQNKPSN